MDAGSHRSVYCILVLLLAVPGRADGEPVAVGNTPSAQDIERAPVQPATPVHLSDSVREPVVPEDRGAVRVASYRTRPPVLPEPDIVPERVAEQTRAVDGRGDPEGEDESGSYTLLGERWHQVGPVTAEYLYTGEVFHNALGGLRTRGATRYRGNFDLTLRLDTEAAQWWNGGEIFVYAQHSHGTTLTSEFIGDGQYYSNLDTGTKPQDLTQLGEYWYQHRLLDDAASVRIGWQDANADFAFADLGGDFANSSFTTLANIPMPFWPFQTLGASALYQPVEQLRLGGGVYDQGQDLRQWWVTTASRGMFGIAQADYLPFADCEGALLTIIRGGAWYTTSDTESTDASRVFEGNYGFYATLDRMVLPEADDAEQGLGAFFQFSWAPPDRNQVDRHYGGGLVYRGLIPERDSDTLGLGFTQISFSADLRDITGQTFENAVELFYKVRLREWLALQPDLQYITRPYGLERDALVAGLRFEAAF